MRGLNRLSNLEDLQGGSAVRFGHFPLATDRLPEIFQGTAFGFSHGT